MFASPPSPPPILSNMADQNIPPPAGGAKEDLGLEEMKLKVQRLYDDLVDKARKKKVVPSKWSSNSWSAVSDGVRTNPVPVYGGRWAVAVVAVHDRIVRVNCTISNDWSP